MLPGQYQRLGSQSPLRLRTSATARRRITLISIPTFLIILFFLFGPYNRSKKWGFGPPTYAKIRQFERELPQHNLDLPFPEGRTGRYVRFDNQVKMLGWNNVLNEVLMNAHLAYESKRSYVFQDYIWKPEYFPWPLPRYCIIFRKWCAPHTPLNAIIAGPTAGGPWDPNDDAPRSISNEWFNVVCPLHERRIIDAYEVKQDIEWLTGDQIFETWKRVLLDAPERCIEVKAVRTKEHNFPQLFDLYLWGSARVLPLWDSFSKSPTSRLLDSSPLAKSAVYRNEYLFLPQGPRPALPASRDPFERMLAMHVRRGDYKDACIDLAKWNSTFYSWNLLDVLPDHFEASAGGGWGWNSPENMEKYTEHCLPTLDAIVQKVRDSKDDFVNVGPRGDGTTHRTLDVLYLLTNEESEWLDQLKETLRRDGWHTIRTSRDLTLDQEQRDVSMAVDMDIATRAAVFVGNGWSSFTSNIVHRRLVDGKEPITIRFF
ncbi:hypothetical protein BDP27DRAFT_1299073 [Rhodocollybia butyracea]|uniref:Uncharacterized protein n=1 Tax=Rhodocollybia butyracea TaxID=206335 RepID=A0A9P5U416_9AGAR|nr:hypothetical protein BDP27DRAFT_1299073 [Rhodocollybia butyracea]